MWEFWSKVMQTVVAALILTLLYAIGRWMQRFYTERPEQVSKMTRVVMRIFVFLSIEVLQPLSILYFAHLSGTATSKKIAFLNWMVALGVIAVRCLYFYTEVKVAKVLVRMQFRQKYYPDYAQPQLGELPKSVLHTFASMTLGQRFLALRIGFAIMIVWIAMFVALRP